MRGMRNVISLAYYHSHYFFCFAAIYVNLQLHVELLFLFKKRTNSLLILCSEYNLCTVHVNKSDWPFMLTWKTKFWSFLKEYNCSRHLDTVCPGKSGAGLLFHGRLTILNTILKQSDFTQERK